METTAEHVDADDGDVADLLRETVELVRHHGGHLIPGSVVVERDHDLWIEFRGDVRPDGPIIAVPRNLLVPLDGITWADDDVRPSGDNEVLSVPALRSWELLAAIYEACDKIDRFRATSPRLAAGADPDLERALAATRRPGASVAATSAVSAFVSSRVLASRDPDGATARRQVLMPLIDAANHDHAGATYRLGNGMLGLEARRPLGTAECFASYGQARDPLDLALHYGFVSSRAPVANSAPAVIDLPDGRRVRVDGQRPGQRRAPTVTAGDEELVVSHLMFRDDRPGSARAELTMAVGAWVLGRGATPAEAERLGRAAWAGVLGSNRTVLDDLRRVAGEHGGPVSGILGAAVDLQSAIILRSDG